MSPYRNKNITRNNLPSTILFIDRELFLKLDRFSNCGRGEDTKLTQEIKNQGTKLYFIKEIKGSFFQEVSLSRFFQKCFLMGSNVFFIKLGLDITPAVRASICLLSPFISLVKYIRIMIRNVKYQEKKSNLIILMIAAPILFFGAIFWNLGVLNSMIFSNDFNLKH